jgi:HK97 family phage portal protein
MALTLLDLSDAKINALAERRLSLISPVEEWAEALEGLKTASGKLVTREHAMRCAGVLTCVRILTEDVPSLPFILKRKTPKGATEATNHPAYRLLKSAPNPFQTAFELKEHIMLDFLLNGKFFVWQVRDGRGNLQALYPLQASKMSFQGMFQNEDLVWQYGQQGFPSSFTHQQLWRGQILNRTIIDGQAIPLLAREAIGLALAAEEQGARLFSNGIQTDIVLKTPDTLDDEQKETLYSSLQKTYGGSTNAWKALLLENGLDASKIGLTAQESQYIESRNYQLADIARMFRMPGVMLGLEDKTNTYASASQFFDAYKSLTLGPWTIRLEQTGERDLILPIEAEKGYFFKHNFNYFLRADQKTRFETYKMGIEAGVMQPEEAREEEDFDKLDGLDYTLMPASFVMLRDGKPVTMPGSNQNGGLGTSKPRLTRRQTAISRPRTKNAPKHLRHAWRNRSSRAKCGNSPGNALKNKFPKVTRLTSRRGTWKRSFK